jgi:hypothetical protein
MIRIAATIQGRAGRVALLLALSLVMASAAAFAQPARKGLVFDQGLQAAWGPLGAQTVTKLFYRQPLSDKGGALWESTKIDFGIKNSLSPAYDMAGVFVDILPIAIFDLAFSAQAIGYFDALGYGFKSVSGYDAGFDDAALDSIQGKNAFGFMLTANPTFQIAAGPIVVMDSFNVNAFSVDDREGCFHEAIGGCVLKKQDIELTNDAYALYTFSFGLMLGVNDSILYVPGSRYASHCLQGIGVYSAQLSEKLSFYSALTCGTFLEDRYYEGMLRISGQAGVTLNL